MAVQIESITLQDGFLEVTLQGISEHNDFLDHLPIIRDALNEHELRKGLIDCTKIEYKENVLHEHTFAEYLTREFPRPVKLALVSPWSPPYSQPHVETAARNRGVNVLVFRSREAAVGWLCPTHHEKQSRL